MTQTRGISSEEAKRELGWTLRYPSWRMGFAEAWDSAKRPLRSCTGEHGRERVARTVLAGMPAYARPGVRIQVTEVNGQPGAMAFDSQDQLVGVMGLGIVDGQIQTIHAIVNPDKQRHLARVSDLGARLRAGRRPRDG
jgi:hypothetical protein